MTIMELADEEFTAVIDNAFHDLSSRSTIFRSKLIEEFQLLENLAISGGSTHPPQHNSRDIKDPLTLNKILNEGPYQLIKYQAFKRTKETTKVDRRLTRMRNYNSVPFGAWAGWVVNSSVFQNGILFLIVFNAILVGIVAEYNDRMGDVPGLADLVTLTDNVSLVIFYIDILLRWADDFTNFWSDGWQVFDFVITIATTIPEIISAVSGANSGIGKTMSKLRTFRILRTLKAAVRFVSLQLIVITIIEAFRSMALIMVLLLLVTYIFAIIGIYGFESYSHAGNSNLKYSNSFVDLGSTLETLFQFLTLDNWSDIYDEMITVLDPVFTTVYVILWLWTGAFIFKNIFVGVMVTNFGKISEELREQRAELRKVKKFERMRRKLKKELNLAKSTIQKSLGDLQSAVEVEKKETMDSVPTNIPQTSMPSHQYSDMWKEMDQHTQQSVAENDIHGKQSSLEVLNNIQRMLSTIDGVERGWKNTVEQTLSALAGKSEETMWPRDSLFRYFQLMESLQENMREHQELQTLADLVLLEIHDT